jgi:hypothetical protein
MQIPVKTSSTRPTKTRVFYVSASKTAKATYGIVIANTNQAVRWANGTYLTYADRE